MKADIQKLFETVAIDGYKDYAKLSKEQIAAELNRVANLLDDYEIHNHNVHDSADQGWFLLCSLLSEASLRLAE